MNYLLAVMEAVTNSVDSINQQQLADGNSTTLDMNVEQNEYNVWTINVQTAAGNVNYWAGRVQASPSNKGYAAQLTNAQTNFQNVETEQQTYTQQADGGTQAEQNQVGQDSSNAQAKVQLESAVNQVAQTLSAALGQHY